MRAQNLEVIEELGRGAYGVVEKMRHRATGNILAVKVKEEKTYYKLLLTNCCVCWYFCCNELFLCGKYQLFRGFALPLMMKVKNVCW